MKLTRDEKMLVLLYGDGTKEGLIRALTEMRGSLQPDERELAHMTDALLKKLSHMTEQTFRQMTEDI